MLIFMFSLAGIPPLAGFWGKLYIFMAAVEAKLFWPAVLGVLASRRGVLLLPAHRQGDVLRRGQRGDRPAAVFGVNRAVAFAAALLVALFSLLPQPLSADRRRGRQGPVPVTSAPVLPDGWTLVALQSVGSTNDEAARLAEAGAREGTVVWAREQTGGRGRRGRRLGLAGRQSLQLDHPAADCPARRGGGAGLRGGARGGRHGAGRPRRCG